MIQDQHPPLKDFPPLIGRALSRISGCDGAGLSELNYQGRMLLARIVRNICVRKPEESVRVSNNCLAAGLGISDRTVRRIKISLEESGWITRHQKQSRRHGMQVSDIWLTPAALRTLGLIADATATCVPPEKTQVTSVVTSVPHPAVATVATVVPSTPSEQSHSITGGCNEKISNSLHEKTFPPLDLEKSKNDENEIKSSALAILADAHCISLDIQSSTKSHPAVDFELSTGSTEAQPHEAQPKEFAKKKVFGGQSALPDDVAILETKGLTRFAVFKLMGIATRKGKRLGQIVTAMGEGLFKARNLFSYVKKLIDVDRDWSTYKAPIVLRREDQEQRLAEAKSRSANRTFVLEQFSRVVGFLNLARTKFLYLVDEAIYSRDETTGEEMGRVVAFDQIADALRAGKLIPK